MDKRTFIKTLSLLPLGGIAMNLNTFSNIVKDSPHSEVMPFLFVGHGNPMNAITDNIYRKGWADIAQKLPVPKAILCISAHWLTKGTFVTMAENPKTIHDFGGFPQELFEQQYPAPGAVEFAELTSETVKSNNVLSDFDWGLDHGAWSVLMNMYPKADIPVYQMSIDFGKPMQYHFELAKELSFLRKKGVLIIGSGNVVHNLRMAKWKGDTKPYDWAIEFDNVVKTSIEENNPENLISYEKLGSISNLAHPTNDHYIPLIYALGLRDIKDDFFFFNDSFDMGSMSMRSVLFK
ncbi:MAG: 4,5-DOPA dioxygenase extradiol [Candidatus Kapabacteria bacterium]|nr:4,5-DOPA dioxygenase extradiol [Candidatus Kapabacteria bacterium]